MLTKKYYPLFLCTLVALLACSFEVGAQGALPQFKPVVYNAIKGAQSFEQPRLLLNEKNEPIYVGKTGHAYPTLFDWNGDGKLDLLVGEFAGGKGSNIMVFENKGSNKKPKYAAEGYYATDVEGEKLHVTGY